MPGTLTATIDDAVTLVRRAPRALRHDQRRVRATAGRDRLTASSSARAAGAGNAARRQPARPRADSRCDDVARRRVPPHGDRAPRRRRTCGRGDATVDDAGLEDSSRAVRRDHRAALADSPGPETRDVLERALGDARRVRPLLRGASGWRQLGRRTEPAPLVHHRGDPDVRVRLAVETHRSGPPPS